MTEEFFSKLQKMAKQRGQVVYIFPVVRNGEVYDSFAFGSPKATEEELKRKHIEAINLIDRQISENIDE